jgi:hypothetical protein
MKWYFNYLERMDEEILELLGENGEKYSDYLDMIE